MTMQNGCCKQLMLQIEIMEATLASMKELVTHGDTPTIVSGAILDVSEVIARLASDVESIDKG